MPHRAEWEIHVLFLAWLATFLHATLRPARRAWPEQAWFAAFAFGLLPLVNVLTTARHLGVTLPQGDWVMAGFEVAMLGIGLLFLATAWRLSVRHPKPRAAEITADR